MESGGGANRAPSISNRDGMKDLSVVVITRNEQARIGSCLAACVAALELAKAGDLVASTEVILVDSASTDRTIEIAEKFPISIIKLPAHWPLSAAAGRFVGLRHATGSFVLFVDGDYVLRPEWLPPAIRTLRKNQDLAAICGPDIEDLSTNSLLGMRVKSGVENPEGPLAAIPVGLYRRDLLTKIGGIHPFLRGAEDRDVAYRLREAGYRLERTDSIMGVHHWADSGPLDFVTYFRSVLNWSIGDGQIYRIRREVRGLRVDIRRRYFTVRFLWNYLLGLALCGLFLLNLTYYVVGPAIPIVTDAAVLTALLIAILRSRAPRELLYQLHVIPYSLIRHSGFIIGFLRPPLNPSRYPVGEAPIGASNGPINAA